MDQLLAMRAMARVIETGSFSRASDQLGIPRSTVSKLINDLEKHLGLKLLHRTTRTVSSTAEGLEYYAYAIRLIAELDEVDNTLRGKKFRPAGHLRIEAPAVFAINLLIPALSSFQQDYPEITVSLGIGDRTVNMVGEGVDCAIRAGVLQDAAIIGRRLTELEYIICASPAYLQTYGIPTDPCVLEKEHRLIGYFFAASGKVEPMVLIRGERRYEILSSHYAANDGNGVTRMMMEGMGIGQVLKATVRDQLADGQLVPILQDWRRPALPVHLLYPPNRLQSARLRVFTEWALRTFA
ncbi:TPA: LysR family transcriptional regulator [Klebsiella variicola subsp. variicola]|nr:LysR family transcriptional regulator [Klebsiella variicola subsp. variicola]HCI6297415.1 LysR family transcriptional regulator [Klebsiella variicola subsp. variicola]